MAYSHTGNRQSATARVIIVDDHEMARSGLRSMLEGDRGLEIVGEGTNGREAVELCRTLRPDLALLDIRMPELDGLAATRMIKQECPTTSVLIITTHESPDYLMAALKAGAAGYLLKDVTRQELLTTIRRVLRGESILSGQVATRALQQLAGHGATAGDGIPERLTRRELEVLAFVVDGQTNREIAAKLSLSVGTVKIHVEHIIAKLGVSDRTQAAVRAVELNLLRPDIR
jgi:DNA-binding NarL/FixJ family response regulator